MSCVIYGERWLNYLGGLAISYLSDIPIEKLDDGYKAECRLCIIFVTWCIVKLDCYVTLFGTCNIITVYNYIINMGIKMISWIWGVGDVTKTS